MAFCCDNIHKTFKTGQLTLTDLKQHKESNQLLERKDAFEQIWQLLELNGLFSWKGSNIKLKTVSTYTSGDFGRGQSERTKH